MSIETRSRNGRYEVIHRRRRESGGAWILRALPAWLGFALLFAPVLVARPETGLTTAGLVALEILLLAAGLRLLAEASRQGKTVTVLHIAPGEIEVRRGRGLFSLTRALGAVETDRFLLTRSAGPTGPVFSVAIVPRLGSPVRVVHEDPDEAACRDVALVLSQGMGVGLDDLRYTTAGSDVPPARVARSGDDRRTVLTWDYRDRMMPRAAVLAIGGNVALSSLMPALTDRIGAALVPVVIAVFLSTIAVLLHVLVTVSERRVTLRSDAVRLERFLANIPLVQRLALFLEIKAVLILKRGPLAAVHVRMQNRGRGMVFPLEDPGIAAWLKHTIEQAAHRAGEKTTAVPGPPRVGS